MRIFWIEYLLIDRANAAVNLSIFGRSSSSLLWKWVHSVEIKVTQLKQIKLTYINLIIMVYRTQVSEMGTYKVIS